jgi:hypothetical protein
VQLSNKNYPEFLGLFTKREEPENGFCADCRTPLVPPSYHCGRRKICLECAERNEKEVAEAIASQRWLFAETSNG